MARQPKLTPQQKAIEYVQLYRLGAMRQAHNRAENTESPERHAYWNEVQAEIEKLLSSKEGAQ